MANRKFELQQNGPEVQAALNKIIEIELATPETPGLMSAEDKAKLDELCVKVKTTSEWAELTDYVPIEGEIDVYSDHDTITRDEQEVYVPGIKIGDGNTLVGELPFIDDATLAELRAHTSNTEVHITDNERTAWNAKYDKPAEGIPASDLADGVIPDISGKADKSEMAVSTDGDQTTITLKTGTSATVLNAHQSISGKADKVSGATNNNFATLDSNGNLKDSGKKASDFASADLVPAQASSENQLADKAFVNSSIGTATATFRGTYNLVSDLSLTTSATDQQIAAAIVTKLAALGITADNEDYVFVQIPNTDADPTVIARVDRYKYNGTAWSYEWSLNNSSFTAAQWAAINSGVTDTAVSKLAALPTRSELTQEIAGKVVLCLYNNMVYYYAYRTSSVIIFASISVVIPRSICYLSVTLMNNTWSNNNLAVELSGNKKSGWSSFPADENYPSEKLAYDSIYPAVGSSQPSGGFLPNKPYDIGEISGNVTFSLASPSDANIANHYYFAFDTGATAPTITWPANISWVGTAPDIIANKHYEISIIDGVGVWMEA